MSNNLLYIAPYNRVSLFHKMTNDIWKYNFNTFGRWSDKTFHSCIRASETVTKKSTLKSNLRSKRKWTIISKINNFKKLPLTWPFFLHVRIWHLPETRNGPDPLVRDWQQSPKESHLTDAKNSRLKWHVHGKIIIFWKLFCTCLGCLVWTCGGITKRGASSSIRAPRGIWHLQNILRDITPQKGTATRKTLLKICVKTYFDHFWNRDLLKKKYNRVIEYCRDEWKEPKVQG
jgi:NADH:ubiquinone oxidoreductase subunit